MQAGSDIQRAAHAALNAVLHRDTAKISYNMPYARTVEAVPTLSQGCGSTRLVHHDVVLTYQFEQLKLPQLSPYQGQVGDFFYSPAKVPSAYELRPGDCVIAIDTAGSLDDSAWLARTRAAAQLHADLRRKLGHDSHAAFKRQIAGTDFHADLIVLTRYVVTAPVQLAREQEIVR
ncbi:MAG: hypothetical protein P0Y56_04375 [Candidatus Andeanibacterium colombiense]|uniref:Uncharacterized protein n=1 Tax=Candidatus Andeanibacterium colombiense TaxID=3121345 RepID=A0AAJ5X7P6_9SPHN|nr:MAG: hypothetical protein P0Y56_04375 [Sphingomonadaceae bacterium]